MIANLGLIKNIFDNLHTYTHITWKCRRDSRRDVNINSEISFKRNYYCRKNTLAHKFSAMFGYFIPIWTI